MSNFGAAAFLNPSKPDYTDVATSGVNTYFGNLAAKDYFDGIKKASGIQTAAEIDYLEDVAKARVDAESASNAPRMAGELLSAGLGVAGAAADAGLFGGGGGGFEYGKTKLKAGGGSVGGIGTYGPNYGFPTW